jgi:hypothetical protein
VAAVELAAVEGDPLAHADQALAGTVAAGRAVAVVGDLQLQIRPVVVLGVAWLALHPLWAAAADPAPPTPTDTTTAPPTTQPEAEREPEPVPDEEEVPDEEWQAPDEGEVITARVGPAALMAA